MGIYFQVIKRDITNCASNQKLNDRVFIILHLPTQLIISNDTNTPQIMDPGENIDKILYSKFDG